MSPFHLRELIAILGLCVAACTSVQTPEDGPGISIAKPDPVVSAVDTTWAGVGRQCAASEPVWDPPVDSAARRFAHGRDVEWASIARDVPGGFAGLYLEGARVVVLLTDTVQKAAALQAVAARMPRSDLNVMDARIVRSRWNFAQLHDWWAYIAAQSMEFGGLTTFDIDERENRLVYGFQNRTSLRAAEVQIQTLDLPCYLIAFILEDPVRIR